MLQIAQEIVYFAHINSNHIMYKYKATAFASAETLNASGKLWPMK